MNLSPPTKLTYLQYILGAALVLTGILVLSSKRTLDAIIILGNPSEKTVKRRTERAIRGKDEEGNESTVFILTGGQTPGLDNTKYHSEAQIVYKQLRDRGIRPMQMRAETRSTDSIENIVYALEKVQEAGATEIGVASYPGHLDRIEEIIEEGQKTGKFDREIHIHRLETEATTRDRLYEPIAGLLTRYKLRRTFGAKREGLLGRAGRYIVEKVKGIIK